jgi:hypothetical protein
MTIHNQYPDLDLTSPTHCGNGTTPHLSSSQQTDTGTIMKASFEIDSKQNDFRGALLYKLQRKYITRTGNQPNSSTASIKKTAANIYLLVVWNVSERDNFCVCPIECTNEVTWDKSKLWTLCRKYNSQFCNDHIPNISVWSVYDGKMMEIRRDITYGSDYKLDIILSKGTGKHKTKKPMKIDPKRLVLIFSMLIVLIYAASLYGPPIFKLNVQNQCTSIDLVSPIYTIGRKLKSRKIHVDNTARSSFIINKFRKKYVLIYKLQRKRLHKSRKISQDTSNATQLLVVCKFSKPKMVYTDVLLVEHNEGFDWSNKDLRKLYRKNSNQFRLFSGPAAETWSLDDNIALMITFEAMNKGRKLDITISEVERDSSTRAPIHIDLKR